MRYTVTAERGQGPVWVLQCQEHPGAISQGRRLADAPGLMKEAIAFVSGVPQDEVEIEVRPVLSDHLRKAIDEARQHVQQAAAQQVAAGLSHRAIARELRAAGMSGADIAVVLEVSPQRVSQLVNS